MAGQQRLGPQELLVKEQQLESWEEKLAQRASALVETAKTLIQRRSAVGPLATMLQQQGGQPPQKLQELMVADPLMGSPHVAAAREQAAQLREQAIDARHRAMAAWDEDLNKQT